jgi:hypothetical protein
MGDEELLTIAEVAGFVLSGPMELRLYLARMART